MKTFNAPNLQHFSYKLQLDSQYTTKLIKLGQPKYDKIDQSGSLNSDPRLGFNVVSLELHTDLTQLGTESRPRGGKVIRIPDLHRIWILDLSYFILSFS